MDREAIAMEFDEMKKELMTLANTQDSSGTFLFAGLKQKLILLLRMQMEELNIKVIEVF